MSDNTSVFQPQTLRFELWQKTLDYWRQNSKCYMNMSGYEIKKYSTNNIWCKMWSPAECAWQETKLISFFLIESVLFYPSGYQSPVDIILLLVKKKKPWECFKGWQKLTKVKCRQDTSKMPVRWVSRGNHLASTCMHLCTSGNPEKYIHLLAQSAGLTASNWFMKLFPGKPGKRHLHVQSPEREKLPRGHAPKPC